MSIRIPRPGVSSVRVGGSLLRGDVDLTAILDGKAPLDFSTGDPRIAPELLPYRSIVADLPLNPALLPASVCKGLYYAVEDQMTIVEPVAGQKMVAEWFDQSANQKVLRQLDPTKRFRLIPTDQDVSPFYSSYVRTGVAQTNWMQTQLEDGTPDPVTGLTGSMVFLFGVHTFLSGTVGQQQGLATFEDFVTDVGSSNTGSPYGLLMLNGGGGTNAISIRYYGGVHATNAHNIYNNGNAMSFAGYAGMVTKQGENAFFQPPYMIGRNRLWPMGGTLATSTGGGGLVPPGEAKLPPDPYATFDRPFSLGRCRLTNTLNNHANVNLVYMCVLNLGVDVSPWCGGLNDPSILCDRVNRYLLENTATFGQYFKPY